MNFNLDIAIFIVFLITNLIVGIFSSKRVNTVNEYALGGRNFSTAAIVATTVATFTTGSSFFVTLSKTYSDGLLYLIPIFGWCLQFFIISLFIIPRMGEFMGALSVAEVMGNLYGKIVRMITAISGILWIVGGIAVQFKVFATLFNYFFGIDSTYAIFLASSIVIIYSTLGGIRAVTHTDIIQFFTFGFVIPLIGIVIWHQFQDMGLTLSESVNSSIFNLDKLYDLEGENLLNFVFLILYFAFPKIGPIHFQRISMGHSVSQAKTAFLVSSFLFVLLTIAIAWIPFLVHSINPSLEPNQVTSYIINNYTFNGLKGLTIVGVSAMAMSSADSLINGSAVLFGHDLRAVFNIKVNDLVLSRIFSVILGAFAIYLAISTNDLLSVLMTAASFYIPVVSVPLLFAIFGFRTTKTPVLISMFVGFFTVIVWKFLPTKIECIIPAIIANFISFIGSHYLLKQGGGWVGIKDKTYLEESKKWRKDLIAKYVKYIKDFNLLTFCKTTAPKNELMYTVLGVYCIFFTISTIYSTQISLSGQHKEIILVIYQIMMCTGTVIAMYPIWPQKIKKEIIVQVAWNIVIFYMLVFFSCFFVMLSGFAQLQFVIFTINMIVTAILVGWRLGLPMMIIGFYLSIEFYQLYWGTVELYTGIDSPHFIFVYSLMLIGCALVIFLKPKQEYLEETEKRVTYLESEVNAARNQFDAVKGSIQKLEKQFEEKEGTLKEKEKFLLDQLKIRKEEVSKLSSLKDEFVRNIMHESNTPMTSILTLSDILYTYYDKLDKAEIKQSVKDIIKGGERLKTYISSITDLSKLSSLSYKLKYEDVNLSNLVKERPYLYKKIFSEESEQQSFVFDVQENIIIRCDKYYMTQALDNLISNAVKYGNGNPIKILLRAEKNGIITFEIRDQGIGIPTNELIKIFDKFTVSSKTATPAEGRGIGLALVDKIIKTHGGKIWAESDGKSWSVFRFTLGR